MGTNHVVMSNSLMVTDIENERSCRGNVHIFWFLTQPLWAQLRWGSGNSDQCTNSAREPTADCLLQVLYEVGIYANLAVESVHPSYYATIECSNLILMA